MAMSGSEAEDGAVAGYLVDGGRVTMDNHGFLHVYGVGYRHVVGLGNGVGYGYRARDRDGMWNRNWHPNRHTHVVWHWAVNWVRHPPLHRDGVWLGHMYRIRSVHRNWYRHPHRVGHPSLHSDGVLLRYWYLDVLGDDPGRLVLHHWYSVLHHWHGVLHHWYGREASSMDAQSQDPALLFGFVLRQAEGSQ